MTAVLGWLLLAAAILSVPVATAGKLPAEPTIDATREPPGRTVVGLLVAVGATGCACVVTLGVPSGLVAAGVLCPVAAVAMRGLQRRPVPMTTDRSVALALDLAAAALHSGRPVADALAVSAPAANPGAAAALLRVAGLLRLGADPAQAWASIDSEAPLGAVAVAAVRSATSGIRLAVAFERLAAQIRAEVGAASAVRAHRAGVVAMAPLGLCFLPSFVCLGVIPVVVGIARSALGVLP